MGSPLSSDMLLPRLLPQATRSVLAPVWPKPPARLTLTASSTEVLHSRKTGFATARRSQRLAALKKAMKDKEAGRKDEDKCYFDKDAKKCVDHTECEQVTKKGWCKKFFKRAPWSCEWNKGTSKCETPYVEPETCEGKKPSDCKEHEDECVSKADGSCETWSGECPDLSTEPECLPKGCIWLNRTPGAIPSCVEECPDLSTEPECLPKGCIWFNGPPGAIPSCVEECPEGWAGDKAGIIAAADGALGGEDAPYARGAVMEYSDPSTRFLGIGNAAAFKTNVARITRGMGKSEWGGDCPEV